MIPLIKGASCNNVKNKRNNVSTNRIKKKKKKMFHCRFFNFLYFRNQLNVTIEHLKDFVRSVIYRLMINSFDLVSSRIYLGWVNV